MEPDLVPINEHEVDTHLCGATRPRSPQWASVRLAYARKHPTCAACGGSRLIQIHHKEPFHLFPEKELLESNFITLCEDPSRLCHHRDGHVWDWKDYNPHVVEDAALHLSRVEKKDTE